MIGIRLKKSTKAIGFFAAVLILSIVSSSHAFAFSMGDSIIATIQSSSQLPWLLSAFSYMIGLVLAFTAIVKTKDHVINPQQTTISEPIKRFLAGGAFMALPMVSEAAYNLYDHSSLTNSGFNVTAGAGALGLDDLMVNFMTDMWDPMIELLDCFCYLAGLILVMVGISRLLKTSQEGPRGPGGMGTIMTFMIAGVLLSIDTLMANFSQSMGTLNGSNVQTMGSLTFTDPTVDMAHVNNVIAAMLAFVVVLGLISFIRGWFIIRDVAEGNHQASLMAGLTHIFGGALAVNLGAVLNAVQSTLGLTTYGIVFN